MTYEEYNGRYINPKCPDCGHAVLNHWDGSEFYCVKCQTWFPEDEAKP